MARFGPVLEVPQVTGTVAAIKTLQSQSVKIHGVNLFNALSQELRTFGGSVATFKKKLDKVMAM